MPRFHFNIFDGISTVDPLGTELAGLQVARLEAVRLAGEVLRDEAKRVALGEDWRMEVTDDTGLILFRIDVNVMDTAATMTARRETRAPS